MEKQTRTRDKVCIIDGVNTCVDKYKSIYKKSRIGKGFEGTSYHIRELVGCSSSESSTVLNNNNTGTANSTEETHEEATSSGDVNANNEQLEHGEVLDMLNGPARKLQGKEIVVDSNLDANQPVDGYKIIHSNILTSIINICSKCPNCGCEKNLSVQQCEKKQKRPK